MLKQCQLFSSSSSFTRSVLLASAFRGEQFTRRREREELKEGQRWLMRVQVEPCPMFQTKTEKKTRPTKHGGGLEPWIHPYLSRA